MNSKKTPAWARSFQQYQNSLRSFLRRRVPDTWEVEDLVQEVYWRLLHADTDAGEREAIHNIRAYLFTVAANLVRERAVLYQRAALQVDITDVLSELHAPDASPEDHAYRQARRLRLIEVISTLPPRCKAVIVMQYREGMSYAEIADAMGISTHMVKKYVVRSLNLCRRALANYEA
ncbi:MAG: sigma-70 family RNA polymerase sigma factor [Pseudoxanthomonas sp.]